MTAVLLIARLFVRGCCYYTLDTAKTRAGTMEEVPGLLLRGSRNNRFARVSIAAPRRGRGEGGGGVLQWYTSLYTNISCFVRHSVRVLDRFDLYSWSRCHVSFVNR